MNLCDGLSSIPKLLLLGNDPHCVLTQYASFTQQLSKGLALIFIFKIFQRETDLWETYTCVTQSTQLVFNTLHLGCIRSTAQIRQSSHRAPSSLPGYQQVDLLSTCCDTDLGTCDTQGWHRSALCSCSRGSGTRENSPPGKNYKQNRQQAWKKQEILSIWHVTGPGNRKETKRRQCEEHSKVHFYSSCLLTLSANINLETIQQKLS